jgi:hypothetical protein
MRWLLVAAILASAPGGARACSACATGDETLTVNGVERPYKNRVRVGLEERYGSIDAGDAVSGESTQFLRSTLAGGWSPISRLTIAFSLPWVTSWVRPRKSPLEELNGLGDLELSGRVVLFRERSFAPQHMLMGTLGLKMPTGPRIKDHEGYWVSDDDQPGSGSWDPFAAITYAWFGGGLTSLFLSTSYRQTTANARGYRRGSVLGWSAAVQLQPWSKVAFQAGVDGVWTDRDRLANGNAMPDTGGTVLYVAPALLVSPVTDLLIRAVVDAPVVSALHGNQSVGTQVMVSIAYDIH